MQLFMCVSDSYHWHHCTWRGCTNRTQLHRCEGRTVFGLLHDLFRQVWRQLVHVSRLSKFLVYSLEARTAMGNSLEMDETIIEPNTIFVGHGYLRHVGVGWTGTHCLRYHIYLLFEYNVIRMNIPDVINFHTPVLSVSVVCPVPMRVRVTRPGVTTILRTLQVKTKKKTSEAVKTVYKNISLFGVSRKRRLWTPKMNINRNRYPVWCVDC